MVHLLLVDRRIEVLVQVMPEPKLSMADVAFPVRSIKCVISCCVLSSSSSMPFDLPFGNDSVGVTLANHAVNGLAIKLGGVRTGASFKVMNKATG